MKFLYINTRNIFPHDRHIIDGLKENGHKVIELEENSPGMKKYSNLAKYLKREVVKYDAIFVGFTSPFFVPIARIFSKNRIIYNATSSQYEGNIVSRGISPFSFEAMKWWLIDFISFHLASLVLLESPSQIKYIGRNWLVKRNKLILSWSGLNEKEYYYEPNVSKYSKFTVLFRGRFLPESGIDTVIKVAKILEDSDIAFLIIGHGFSYRLVNTLMDELKPKNIVMINHSLPIDELRKKMQASHISLGQMADHPRLERTLPCKSFESLAMRLPYLTARNKAVLELLKEDETCLCSKPGDPRDLADKILFLKNRPEILELVAKNGYEFYRQNLTSKILADNLIRKCFA